MNVVVDKFRELTGFTGKISIMGHSLGSIISWDILANQDPSLHSEYEDLVPQGDNPTDEALQVPNVSPISECSGEPERTDPPATAPIASPLYPQLNYPVDNFFLLGSPVPVFLLIRNQRKPLSADFSLPGCNRVFNIFHPYDPVAYRIEPCIDRRNADFEPIIMKHWNGGFRVQYQTKRLWKKIVETTWKQQQNIVEAFEAGIAGMGLLDAASNALHEEDAVSVASSSDENRVSHIVTGSLNRGRRIDFMLQEKEIENANEYVAAFAAHSCYWTEKDLSLFVARQIYLSTLESATEEAGQYWESVPASSGE